MSRIATLSTEEKRRRRNVYAAEYRKRSNFITYRKAYDAKYYEEIYQWDWPRRNLKAVKDRAKVRGYEFNLTIEDFQVPEKCPVLGIPIVVRSTNRDFRPSVDRIDNTKGYIKGNVRVISGRANRIKSDATLDELMCLVEYMSGVN